MAKTPSADHSPHLHPAAAGGAAAVDPNPTAVQIVRSLAVIPTSAIPAVDNSYKAVPKEEMDPLLKIEGKQVAETDKAIEELIRKGDTNLQKDLGNSTPSVATFKTLYAGLVEARESVARALDNEIGDQRDRLRMIELHASFQPASRHHRRHRNQQLRSGQPGSCHLLWARFWDHPDCLHHR